MSWQYTANYQAEWNREVTKTIRMLAEM